MLLSVTEEELHGDVNFPTLHKRKWKEPLHEPLTFRVEITQGRE